MINNNDISLDLDLTNAINNLIEGKASENEQKICGIVLKAFISKKKVKPVYSLKDVFVSGNKRAFCPNCGQPLNTKMKDGKHIHEYCKCCGQGIDW